MNNFRSKSLGYHIHSFLYFSLLFFLSLSFLLSLIHHQFLTILCSSGSPPSPAHRCQNGTRRVSSEDSDQPTSFTVFLIWVSSLLIILYLSIRNSFWTMCNEWGRGLFKIVKDFTNRFSLLKSKSMPYSLLDSLLSQTGSIDSCSQAKAVFLAHGVSKTISLIRCEEGILHRGSGTFRFRRAKKGCY